MSILDNVPKQEYFNAANGTVIKSLLELEPALELMDDVTFAHHVNKEKNDFATWVRDCIRDDDLAETLEGIKNKQKMQIALLRHILSLK